MQTKEHNQEFQMMRFGKIDDMDKSFDIEYWQRQKSGERMAAVWEMVTSYHLKKTGDQSELRLQRTVEHFQRASN